MKLSLTEEKLVARLRLEEEREQRWRYVTLTMGILALVSVASGFWLLANFEIKEAAFFSLFFSIFFPIFIVNMALGIYLTVGTLRNWNGNAVRVLLLKVIDERTQ